MATWEGLILKPCEDKWCMFIKLAGMLFIGGGVCPALPAVWSRTRCPKLKACSHSPILVCPVVAVSVSSQLPVLLQCLLPPHVQSGECGTSKHPNLPAWGSSQQPHPGSSPQSLRATAFCLCVCVRERTCCIVHSCETPERIVALC